MAAAYQATTTLTDDESFGFAVTIQSEGESVALGDYAFEYEVRGCGENLSLDMANGITIDLADNLVIVDPGSDRRLKAGQYRHGFRAKHIESGRVVQLFDGTVTVSEGNFR
jgi:hypothetical protein